MHSFDWTLLESRYVLKDKWISVRADKCRMPGGRIVEPFYVLEYPNWVHVVALTKNREVVLVRQYRHGIQETVLEVPSGCIEKTDVSPLEAAKRELLEETGYTGVHFIGTGRLSPNPANHTNMCFCFLATDVELAASQQLDVNEQIVVELTPLDKVIELLGNGGFLQALHIGALFFALSRLGKVQLG